MKSSPMEARTCRVPAAAMNPASAASSPDTLLTGGGVVLGTLLGTALVGVIRKGLDLLASAWRA